MCIALQYHPDRNIGREETTVEKFQLIQTAHEVLSDPEKKATYDRIRGATGRATAAYTRSTTRSTTVPPQTPKTRYTRQSTGTNGFSKTTPNTTKPAFGYFTTREPPSARKPAANGSAGVKSPSSGFGKPRSTPRKPPEKDRAEAYFRGYRDKASTSSSWQQFSSVHASPKYTPQAKAQQKKEESQKAAGLKTPERKKPAQPRFGTTFEKESTSEEDEEDTFFSFSSNGGTFNGSSKNNGNEKRDNWSERRSAYSHVFTGVKEDLRSPLKAQSTGFPSDGFGGKKNGFTTSKENETATNGFAGGFAKEADRKSDGPPVFAFNGPARRKSSQQQQQQRSTSGTPTTESPPLNPNEIPKTPPPVEERRFASAFSRLNVNPSPTKSVPPKPKDNTINIDDWSKKFEGMNPFMTPGTKKLSEDQNFWSSVPLRSTPLKSTPAPVRGRPVRSRGGGTGGGGALGDMGNLKRELPKMDDGRGVFERAGVAPVSASFNIQLPTPFESSGFPTTSSPIIPSAPPFEPKTPNRAPIPQQPTPAPTPSRQPPPPEPLFQPNPPSLEIPILNAPIPPKQLIPRPSDPKEFSFSVPSKPEMQLLAAEVQAYHTSYVIERSRFEEAWNKYEAEIQFQFTNEERVRSYLEAKDKVIRQRAEMESLHSLCLERWGSVAKFSGFIG